MSFSSFYLEVQDDSQVMHEISNGVKLVLAVNVIARRIFADYLPKFLLLNYSPDLVFPFVGILQGRKLFSIEWNN